MTPWQDNPKLTPTGAPSFGPLEDPELITRESFQEEPKLPPQSPRGPQAWFPEDPKLISKTVSKRAPKSSIGFYKFGWNLEAAPPSVGRLLNGFGGLERHREKFVIAFRTLWGGARRGALIMGSEGRDWRLRLVLDRFCSRSGCRNSLLGFESEGWVWILAMLSFQKQWFLTIFSTERRCAAIMVWRSIAARARGPPARRRIFIYFYLFL